MSEYQYYELRCDDRPLSAKQMEQLRKISSRAQITPSSFVNVYNYGDFRGDPDKLIDKYFDAFLYLANWGTRWLMVRVPRKLLSSETAATFGGGDCLSIRRRGDHMVLSFRSEDEEDYEWAEGEGWLGSLLPLRSSLMRGDHRALYLGWLLAVQPASARAARAIDRSHRHGADLPARPRPAEVRIRGSMSRRPEARCPSVADCLPRRSAWRPRGWLQAAPCSLCTGWRRHCIAFRRRPRCGAGEGGPWNNASSDHGECAISGGTRGRSPCAKPSPPWATGTSQPAAAVGDQVLVD